MARGLIISSQSKTFIRTTIGRVSSSHSKFRRNPFASNHKLFAPSFLCSNRFLCCCCSSTHHHDPIDMSKYKETFSERMAMAGLKPHHRMALGVSGGPDSMALCVLAADWKSNGVDATGEESSGFIDGLLAIVVDHGLRAESKDEANTVRDRVLDMGIRCVIARCEWPNGRPKLGQLQEAARDMRYETFQNVCIQHQIGVLLIAHHGDDQAELFILRLSRNSGVLGLAGMAFSSQLFPMHPNFNGEESTNHGILLVRPLLEFSKEDMYKICQGGNQNWVEDPTNQSPMFARNRIRMSLKNLSSPSFKSELQAVVSACRRTRLWIHRVCHDLIDQAVTIMAHGYAVIDLEILNPSKIHDICLSKFIALVLQFISQRHRPVRGSASKLLLDYVRTCPCKTSLTAAGCYLCAAPGSRGTKVLVCCSLDSCLPSKMELLQKRPYEGEIQCFPSEVGQIIADGKSYSDGSFPDASYVQFLDSTSSESVISEAKRLDILSESTHGSILSLQRAEVEHFKSKSEVMSELELKNDVEPVNTPSKALQSGEIGYFMNRFKITYSLKETNSNRGLGDEIKHYCCWSCRAVHDTVAEVRPMVDADWLYLARLAKGQIVVTPQGAEEMNVCSDYAKLSAQRALLSLKLIPVAARRGLPVLVNPEGLLLSIPSIGFNHCPCLMVSAAFKPRVPLGGGYSSFI